jgi:hypothetical protein
VFGKGWETYQAIAEGERTAAEAYRLESETNWETHEIELYDGLNCAICGEPLSGGWVHRVPFLTRHPVLN